MTDTPQTEGIRLYHKRNKQMKENWQRAVKFIEFQTEPRTELAEPFDAGFEKALRDIRQILTANMPEAK